MQYGGLLAAAVAMAHCVLEMKCRFRVDVLLPGSPVLALHVSKGQCYWQAKGHGSYIRTSVEAECHPYIASHVHL